MNIQNEELSLSNELIADFMELEKVDDDFGPSYKIQKDIGYEYVYPEDLVYHNSWKMLMEVLAKIEAIGFSTKVERRETVLSHKPGLHKAYFCKIWEDQNTPVTIKGFSYRRSYYNEISKKEAVYKSIVEFINWYNKQIEK